MKLSTSQHKIANAFASTFCFFAIAEAYITKTKRAYKLTHRTAQTFGNLTNGRPLTKKETTNAQHHLSNIAVHSKFHHLSSQ